MTDHIRFEKKGIALFFYLIQTIGIIPLYTTILEWIKQSTNFRSANLIQSCKYKTDHGKIKLIILNKYIFIKH